MKNKILAYLLIGLGVLDLYMLLTTRRSWTNELFGNNILTQIGSELLFIAGIYLLRKAKSKDQVLLDNIHIDHNEKIIHQEMRNGSIVVLTTQMLRLYLFEKTSEKRIYIPNYPKYDRMYFYFDDIISVSPVTNRDIEIPIGRIWLLKFGIQLKLKNGELINIPISNSEMLANLINYQIMIYRYSSN